MMAPPSRPRSWRPRSTREGRSNTKATAAKAALNMTLFTSLANVVLADATVDGNLDAVISSSGNPAIYLGDGKGALTYDKTLQNPLFLDLAPVMVADLNGDGIPDIGQMCANSFAIFLGKGKGAFESPFYIGAGPSPSDQLIANLHGQPPPPAMTANKVNTTVLALRRSKAFLLQHLTAYVLLLSPIYATILSMTTLL